MWKTISVVTLAAMMSMSSVAVAQTKPAAPAKPRTAASIECSKQADQKNLHGKARKTFRSTCMKQAPKSPT